MTTSKKEAISERGEGRILPEGKLPLTMQICSNTDTGGTNRLLFLFSRGVVVVGI